MIRLATPLLLLLFLVMANPCRAGLIHDYTFAQNANDSVGNANGILMNGASVVNGALQLNAAAQQYVQFSQQLIPTSGSFTVSIFGQQTSLQASFVELVSQGYHLPNGFYIGQGDIGQIRAGDLWQFTGVPFPTDLSRHNYTVTVDAVLNVSDLYFDGRLVANMNAALTTQAGNYFTKVGKQFDPYAEYFNGRIDNLAIYNNALTAAQVMAIANAAVPEPSSIILLGFATLGLSLHAIRTRFRSSRLRELCRGQQGDGDECR